MNYIHNELLTSAPIREIEDFDSLFNCVSSLFRRFFSLSMLSERWLSFPSKRDAFSSAEAAADSALRRRFNSFLCFA